MCLAVPLKIIEINGNEATGDIDGISRKVRIDFIKDIKEGDYVIVHAGFAIEKIDEKTAIENLNMILEASNVLG